MNISVNWSKILREINATESCSNTGIVENAGDCEGATLQVSLPQPGHKKISLKLLNDSGLRLNFLIFDGVFDGFLTGLYPIFDGFCEN